MNEMKEKIYNIIETLVSHWLRMKLKEICQSQQQLNGFHASWNKWCFLDVPDKQLIRKEKISKFDKKNKWKISYKSLTIFVFVFNQK